ncbi:Ribosome biogenesis protein NSA1 [Vanrija pseudolonga]|uniref:Ribosome biogenesis protein NSA1 n=1 Tax=Vanrija pseudolonga TaxID=143232 RepID=A0AAF0XZX2_9TREE|nr:Ribosome biogenesis protein NSA1 [Vanrija pseudolonga]
MTTYRTLDFWTPALHPSTLLNVSVAEPGPSRDPVVRSLPIKHGDFEAVGAIKRLVKTNEGFLAADDSFRISALTVPVAEDEVPVVTSQSQAKVPSRGLSVWTGLTTIEDGAAAISSLSTGRLSLFRGDANPVGTFKAGGPVLATSSPGSGSLFALGGKEVEVSVWDASRAFEATASSSDKRKKDDLAPGEVWRAKNVAHNHLQLRQPVHHLSSAFLPGSSTDLVTGTKSGAVRRYDTRQRKPVGDWKVAREGGVGAVAPGAENELFFADHSNLVAALDLRTGRVLYTVPANATANALLTLPEPVPRFAELAKTAAAGLASISSDATFRIFQTTPPPAVMPKGNWATGGKKSTVLSSAYGVGVGSFVFAGFGSRTEAKPVKEKAEGEEGDEEEDEEVDDDEEEEIWEGMDEANADSDDDSSEDEAPVKKQRRRQ